MWTRLRSGKTVYFFFNPSQTSYYEPLALIFSLGSMADLELPEMWHTR
jgi:hypothetical protein